MAFIARTRLINPRLGTYYSIFAAALAALFFLLLIFEQLGAPPHLLRIAMLAGPLLLYILIGVASWTSEPLEYFASGRRVPAVFNGLVLAVSALGATGMMAVTGAIFVVGFDALCLAIGGVSGFVVMATALAPYLRKVGCFTVPSYLGRRLHSRAVRLTAAAVLAVPILLVIAAELRLGALAAAWLTGQSVALMVPLLVLVLLTTLALGGMRSLTWSAVAQAILALLALGVPSAIVGVIETNMPVPQLSHGPVLRALGRNEIDHSLPLLLTAPLAVDLPGQGLNAIAKRFASAFGSVGELGFSLMTLSVMAGVACAPWMLPRVGTAPTVYDARKSIGWASFLFGVVMMTLASVAIFMREMLVEVASSSSVEPPFWLRRLVEVGWAYVPSTGTRPSLTGLMLDRDAVLFTLPVAYQLPEVLLYLALAGALAAALAAASSAILALGGILAEDVFNGLTWEPPGNRTRLNVARVTLAVAAVCGGGIALAAPADPLQLVLWSLALTASAAFPVMMLSIWWKRINGWGALAGMTGGFLTAASAIVLCESGVVPVSSALAAVAGVPASLLATFAASLLTQAPDRHVVEMTRDMRIPGGETVFDREMRLMRLRQRQRT